MIKRQLYLTLLVSSVMPGIYAEASKTVVPASTTTTSAAKPLNIRYVNTLETMQGTKKGSEISVRLEKKRKDLGDGIQQKEKEITKLMQEFESKKSTLSASAREKEESKIVKLRRDYESTVQASEDELKLAMQRATEELSKEIEEAVVAMAQREGYDIVMDTYTGRTIYAAPKVVVTGDLVKVMDTKYAASGSKSTSSKVTA